MQKLKPLVPDKYRRRRLRSKLSRLYAHTRYKKPFAPSGRLALRQGDATTKPENKCQENKNSSKEPRKTWHVQDPSSLSERSVGAIQAGHAGARRLLLKFRFSDEKSELQKLDLTRSAASEVGLEVRQAREEEDTCKTA